jgi:hypothetical protein
MPSTFRSWLSEKQRKRAKDMLRWACFSQRPLTLSEFRDALALTGWRPDPSKSVWHDPFKDKLHLRTLNTIQRDVLIRILSAFRTTATQALEMEAYVPSTRLRLKRRGRDVVASLFTQPRDHPIHSVLERASRRAVAKGDAARLPIAQVIKTMDMAKLRTLETLDLRPLEPWRPPVTE